MDGLGLGNAALRPLLPISCSGAGEQEGGATLQK